ncbi:auxin-responsive protein SAUR36-like [Primulina tabacum]|uniref:auxin-responsive protein SAUR36-like n=1 Tax=Primulina tabacum TaxID=48773 RepID=UPI003F59E04E
MGKTRGFRLGRKLVKVFNWFIHRRRRLRPAAYERLEPPRGPVSKLCKWVNFLRMGTKGLCSGKSSSGYIRVGHRPIEQPNLPDASVPKGHLAVYVGDKEDDTSRVLVPVIYFNHPLFGELLKESENLYGFNHPGGIQIPCPKSQLENIQMKIAAARGGGSWRRRRR